MSLDLGSYDTCSLSGYYYHQMIFFDQLVDFTLLSHMNYKLVAFLSRTMYYISLL